MTTTEARLNELSVAIQDLKTLASHLHCMPVGTIQREQIAGLEVAISSLERRRQQVKTSLLRQNIAAMTLAEVNEALEAEYAVARKAGRSNLPVERRALYDERVSLLNDRKAELVTKIGGNHAIIGNGLVVNRG